jgi:cytidyltransferase-like protein
MITVCTSGYFNPLHKGHVRLIQEARKLGDRLVVIVNNDTQVRLKGSVPFMDEMERLEIVSALRDVDQAVLSIDDDSTVCKTLSRIRPNLFAKGGDSTSSNVPEQEICQVVFGVGGGKIQSSSWLKATKS